MFRLKWNIKDAKKYWMEEAHENGKVEGEINGKVESARSLMETLHCTKEKAMELLKIPAELQPKILAML